jgi:hypothetical protein
MRDCNSCEYVNIKESESKPGTQHICTKYDIFLFHSRKSNKYGHRIIIPHPQCDRRNKYETK